MARRLQCPGVQTSRLLLLLTLATSPAWATTYPVGATRAYKSPCLLVADVVLQPGDIVEVEIDGLGVLRNSIVRH